MRDIMKRYEEMARVRKLKRFQSRKEPNRSVATIWATADTREARARERTEK
jgi:hypothetical protein